MITERVLGYPLRMPCCEWHSVIGAHDNRKVAALQFTPIDQ